MAKDASITRGEDEAVTNKLGGVEGMRRFLRDELIVVEKKQIITNSDNAGITFVPPAILDIGLFLADQRKFFREVYGKNLPRVKMPQVRPGFGWGLIMAPFMAPQYLFDCSRERFGKSWKWTNDDLDTIISHNDRDAKRDGAYALWCRDRVEADEEHSNRSYNRIIADAIKGMTVAERENLGLWFHWETGGQQLDVKNITLCTGSRCRDGGVPNVHWNDNDSKMYVDWYNTDNAHAHLRTREVVSK